MSEYNGYFRIATTKDNYMEIYDHDESENDGFFYSERDGRDNRIYVLDLDLNEVRHERLPSSLCTFQFV